MFRFSIRDLFWLTLVVALGLSWFIREKGLREETERLANRATKWRMAAGGLERAIRFLWIHDLLGFHRFIG